MSTRIAVSLIVAAAVWGSIVSKTASGEVQSQLQQAESERFIEDLAPEDVKRFLDPTILINGVAYSFTSNFLGKDSALSPDVTSTRSGTSGETWVRRRRGVSRTFA
jgi:hypothetical protein